MSTVDAAAIIRRALENKTASVKAPAPTKTAAAAEKRYTLEEAWPLFKRAFERLSAEKSASAIDEAAVERAYKIITGDKD